MTRIASLLPILAALAILGLAGFAAADSHEDAGSEATAAEATAPAAEEEAASGETERMPGEAGVGEAPTAPSGAPSEATEPTGAMPGAEPATEPAAEAQPAPPQGEVARAQFTTAVVEREPTDRVETLHTSAREVFFFTELRGFQGHEVRHRWSHEGEVMAEVPFQVEGPRWRVYSSKELLPAWTGEWSVAVVDARGEVVAEESFVYEEAAGSPASSTEAGAAAETEGAAESEGAAETAPRRP